MSTPDIVVKKKELKIPKALTTTDTDGVLGVATKATEHASSLVQELAEEYYTEDNIGANLSKVAKVLKQVCSALFQLSRAPRFIRRIESKKNRTPP